jgi:tRNA threonylcarbamoyladenosine biosynthesis protein TsaE
VPAPPIHLTFRSASEDETVALGVALGRTLRAGDALALDGELGAGKTRLVRGIAEGMGLDPAQVSSPTYVLVHEYAARHGGGTAPTPLLHVDAYRLAGPDDLDSLGWDRVLGAYGVVVVEWAARIMDALLPEPSLGRMRIQADGPDARRLDLLAPPAWAQRPQWRGLLALAQRPADAGAVLPPGWARCPVTGKAVPPDAPTYPFADDRARMADLGKWLTGAYTVSRELVEDDLDDPDLGHPGPAGR